MLMVRLFLHLQPTMISPFALGLADSAQRLCYERHAVTDRVMLSSDELGSKGSVRSTAAMADSSLLDLDLCLSAISVFFSFGT